MLKNIFATKLKYEQQNTSSKRLILSVLNSTATKREARDYLTKYNNEPEIINHCLLFIRHLHSVNADHIKQLSSSIKRLRMLGLRPICVFPPTKHVQEEAEMLDQLITRASLKPLHLKEGLTKLQSGEYESILSSHSKLFDDTISDMVPIIQPYIYDVATATEYLTNDIIKFMGQLSNNTTPSIDKFFILNMIGGTPSLERNENSHVFINLSQEFESLKGQLSTEIETLSKGEPQSEDLMDRMRLHIYEDKIINYKEELKEHVEDLELMNIVLSNLPTSSTGLITTIKSASLSTDTKNPLLYNLLTDRSLISSSLPLFKNGNSFKVQNAEEEEYEELDESNFRSGTSKLGEAVYDTTVYKKGVHIKTFDFKTLTVLNSTGLPEEFNKHNESEISYTNTKKTEPDTKLDLVKMKNILDRSFNRSLNLSHYLNRINGKIASVIVIGDYEGIAILTYEGPEDKPFVYLDKFAVLPHLKGSLGISDILFNLMFKKFPKEVLWRSRKDNIVNKWYFQRSVAVLDLSADLGNGDQKESNFKMFYYGDAESDLESFGHRAVLHQRLKEFAKDIRDIQPSWDK